MLIFQRASRNAYETIIGVAALQSQIHLDSEKYLRRIDIRFETVIDLEYRSFRRHENLLVDMYRHIAC